jgi:hypothetical protein
MAEIPIRSLAPSSTPLRAKLTLATLPVDIKHEIFSYLLLGKNVKYFKPGTVPGYAYAFQTNIARTSKQLYKETDAYLRAHNNFALVHLKSPRLIHDFCPHVAVGIKARSFINPVIEATMEDLEPKAHYPDYEMDFCMGPAKARTKRILFLAQDLTHFCRHLQLDIHVWPSSQIYVHPDRTSSPVQYSPIIVKNERKIIWKVNASHRSDLTLQERRARQQSLISSISAVVGHGLAVRFLGVEEDIAARAITYMTPRIVSVDAAGWNLLENMQSQKRQLDESLIRGPQGSKELLRAYVMVAQLVESSHDWLRIVSQYNTAFLFNTPYGDMTASPVSTISFRSEAELCTMASPWVTYVFTTALECLLNAMSLALDDNDFECLPDICGVAWVMSWNSQPDGVLPQDLCSLAHHYYDWIDLFSRFFDADFDHTHVQDALSDIDLATSIARPDYVYLREDSDYLKDILVVSLWMKLAVCCRFLLMLYPSFRMDLLGASTNVLQALGVANVPSPIR